MKELDNYLKAMNELKQLAKHPKCVCMCGGRFHGSANQPGGIEQAIRDYWEDVMAAAEKKAKEEGLELETERWTKNRQRILGELPKLNKSKKQRQQGNQLPLPLEVA